MVRINKVYTRSGDRGETSLIGGDRVSKASARIECYGTVDELNACLGLVRSALADSAAGSELAPIVARVQNELFDLGAELATPDPERRAKLPRVQERHVEALEAEIDRLNEDLPELRSFVLPGGGWVSAHFHLARTVCRRAERLVVALAAGEGEVTDEAIRYLNRLSDALFVHGRWAAWKDGHPEPLWQPGKPT
jgi:cob(I)alamin adenosyltransferase